MVKRKILFLPRTSLAKDIVSDHARNTLESLGSVHWNPEDRNYSVEELAVMLPGTDAVVTSWGVSERVSLFQSLMVFSSSINSSGLVPGTQILQI